MSSTPTLQPTRRVLVLPDSPLSLGDYSPRLDSGGPPESYQRHLGWRRARVLLLCFALIVVMTAEVIVRKVNVTNLKNYIPFLQMLFVLACVIAFFAMVWYRSRMMPAIEIDRHTMWWFVLIGFLDTFASTLILCAAVFISAPMATLLSQGVIPITMLSSMWFLRRRFHCNHWLGALLIVFSNGVSIVFLYLSLSGNSGVSASATESSVPTFVWAIVFFLSNFPIAGSSIAKEKLLLANMNAGLDLPTLNAWVALYQLLFSIGLAPCVFWLQHMNDSASISELPQIMWWGIKCWLLGQNSMDGDVCQQAVWTVWLHICIIVLLNVLVLRVIFHGSATLFFVASGVTIPFTLVCSALPFLGPAHSDFFWGDTLTVLATLLGLWLYRSEPEEIEFSVDDMTVMDEPAVLPDVTGLDSDQSLTSYSAFSVRPDSPHISSPYAYSRRDDFWDPNESDDEHGALPVTLNGVSRRLPPPPKLNLGRPATSSVQ